KLALHRLCEDDACALHDEWPKLLDGLGVIDVGSLDDTRDDELRKLLRRASDVLLEDCLRAHGIVEIDPGGLETRRDRQERGARYEEDVAAALDELAANEVIQQANAPSSRELVELFLRDGARLVVRPRLLELGFEAEPFADIELPLVDAGDEL